MSRRTYKDETKAAVMAALLQGQSVTSVAKEYEIPKGTVSGWKKKAEEAAPEQIATQKEQATEIGQLLIDYLRANLTALKVQAEKFQNKAWLHKQSAAEVATLHGVMTDKAVRLLEALSQTEGVPEE